MPALRRRRADYGCRSGRPRVPTFAVNWFLHLLATLEAGTRGPPAKGAKMKVEAREGQLVRIIDGPFAGFRGEMKEVDEQTAKVAVQIFGRVTPVDLALGQIELVPKA